MTKNAKEVSAVHVGVVGAGIISEIYLKNMTSRFSILKVDAICSKHMVHAKEKAEKYGITACTFEEMLQNDRIEMIVNLTPVPAHYDIIKRSLMAGKHVYTEKVITDRVEEAAELAALAEEKGLYLGCAPDTFFGSSLQTVRKALDSGMIGEVTSCTAAANRNNHQLLSMFSFLRLPGAGVCLDYGVYYMTALVSLLGPINRVGAFVRAPYKTYINVCETSPEYGSAIENPNESQVSAVLRFASGITGTLNLDSDSVRRDQAHMTINGTKGMLYLGDPNQFGRPVYFLANEDGAEKVELPVEHDFSDNSRGAGPAEMAWAIRTGRTNRANKQLACHVLEVLTAILDCGEEGAFADIKSTCERPESLNISDGEEEHSLM